jgi:MoaA/NifB/PqqE/SkfB family radical SAM enzyme
MLKPFQIFRAWARILAGRQPCLSIELTRECPLRCPGCYAYGDAHLGIPGLTLRQLSDSKGSALVEGALRLVENYRPIQVSLVGGDPLVRYRELDEILPELNRRGIRVQLVTSAFREIPVRWNGLRLLEVVVSVDGLPPEHDVRRKPATYERILKSIAGTKITIHCTVTSQMMHRAGYLEEFVRFWNERPETKRIWVSLFTP